MSLDRADHRHRTPSGIGCKGGDPLPQTRRGFPATLLFTTQACLFVVALLYVTDAGAAECNSQGNYVVVNVPHDDPIGGLAVRASPNPNGRRIGVIPSAGVGVEVQECGLNGWCRVRFGCLSGWSFMARYLAPMSRRLRHVTGVNPSDPQGLNMRKGPGPSYSVVGRIPYNGVRLVEHGCSAAWCLVSYGGLTGWVSGNFLSPGAGTSEATPATTVNKPPTPPPGMPSRGCQLFPDLC